MSPAKNEEAERPHWTIDRRVPVAVIVLLSAQLGAWVWWAATQSERINQLEKNEKIAAERFEKVQSAAIPQAERIVRVEEKLTAVQDGVKEIKTDLKTLLAAKQAPAPR